MFVLLTFIAVCNIPNNVATTSKEDDICGTLISIFPRDPYFLEHQSMVIECTSENRYNNLSFVIGKDLAPDEKCSTECNATYAKLVIFNITANQVRDNKRGTFVKCQDQESSCIDSKFIQLEYYPLAARNISCLVNNFETLLCTWDLGVEYKFMQHMKVTCQFVSNVSTLFKISPRANEWGNCPNATNTSCFWDSNDYHNSGLVILNVSVTNTRVNITRSTQQTVYRDQVLKPSKVKNLTVGNTKDPTCVVASWTPPYAYRNFTYDITSLSECDNKEKTVQFSCAIAWCSCKLCGLYPFTSYTLSIVSRYSPSWEETGFWSDPTIIDFQTPRTKPGKTPLVTDGLYLYDTQYLTLYWQPLDKCDRNSDDTEYEISFDGITKRYPMSAYFMETRLRQTNTSYGHFSVLITTKNREGIAPGSIFMMIYPESEGPRDSELIIENRYNGRGCKEYLATIIVDRNNLKDFVNITHTITWCKVLSGACQRPMNWLKNIPTASGLLLPIHDCNDTYKFGLITMGSQKSTGKQVWTDISFVDCLYQTNTVPAQPLPNIHLSKVMLPNTVTVEWEPYPCVEPVGYIHNYIVTYCEALVPEINNTCDCIKKRIDIKVSNKKTGYTVDDLAPGLDVCVWVSTNTSNGRGPKNKHVLFYTVTGEAKNLPLILFSVGGGICFIILVIFLAVKCVKKVKQRRERLREIEEVPINIRNGEAETYTEPEGPQYPTAEEPFESHTDPFPDSDIDNSFESDEESKPVLGGYADPKKVEYFSDSSVNSQLSSLVGDKTHDRAPNENSSSDYLIRQEDINRKQHAANLHDKNYSDHTSESIAMKSFLEESDVSKDTNSEEITLSLDSLDIIEENPYLLTENMRAMSTAEHGELIQSRDAKFVFCPNSSRTNNSSNLHSIEEKEESNSLSSEYRNPSSDEEEGVDKPEKVETNANNDSAEKSLYCLTCDGHRGLNRTEEQQCEVNKETEPVELCENYTLVERPYGHTSLSTQEHGRNSESTKAGSVRENKSNEAENIRNVESRESVENNTLASENTRHSSNSDGGCNLAPYYFVNKDGTLVETSNRT